MIDPTIRAQLLMLPAAFRTNTVMVINNLTLANIARGDRDSALAWLLAEGVAKGTIDGKNEQTRRAQIDQLLAEDTIYLDAVARMQTSELLIKSCQLSLDALRFEFGVLSTIANNDLPPLTLPTQTIVSE